jgi:hypothetical protein
VDNFRQTCTADTRLLFAVDVDDPTHREYAAIVDDVPNCGAIFGMSRNMVEALNGAANLALAAHPDTFAIGFMGDDHLPRTYGWDSLYLAALRDLGTGIVYGDDLLQRQNLPTQCAMTADIVTALGYMAPPELHHLYVDNAWLVWGNSLGVLRYLPQVVIEHRHPMAGKAEWDEGHTRVNSDEMNHHDKQAFDGYSRSRLREDLDKIAALR